jgi:hypothetical protein
MISAPAWDKLRNIARPQNDEARERRERKEIRDLNIF